jgi:hypothetical protein
MIGNKPWGALTDNVSKRWADKLVNMPDLVARAHALRCIMR